jgi:hypothetical protein
MNGLRWPANAIKLLKLAANYTEIIQLLAYYNNYKKDVHSN